MTVPSILYALASVPMFASRPFLAALVTALIASWGEHIPILSGLDIVAALTDAPAWFRSGWTVGALAILAAAEFLASRSPEVRAVMDEFDAFVRSAVATLVALAVLDSDTARTVEGIRGAGLATTGLWAGVVAIGTWNLARWRRTLFEHLSEIDDGDDVGVQSTLQWIESSWTVGGLLFIVIAPILAIAFAVLTGLVLFALQRHAERRAERARVPCAACGTRVLPHATACPACRAPLAEPRAVGVFGTPRKAAATDLAAHRFQLAARKRCPVCAQRLKQRKARQSCPECRTVTFATPAEFEAYLSALQRRLPLTLGLCLAFSAVPVIGVIPGVIYYRLTLVAGLRGFTPPVRGCAARVVSRVLAFGVLALQPIPVLGALVLPLLCLSAYLVYRRALTGHAREELARTLSPQPAG